MNLILSNSELMDLNNSSVLSNEADNREFNGHIYFFQAFDVGEDIDLRRLEQTNAIQQVPLHLPKYFKNYHTPLAVELPHPHSRTTWLNAKIHNFGVISLTYRVPFRSTLLELRDMLPHMQADHQEQSVVDAHTIFKRIKDCTVQPKFFHLRTSYTVIQVNTDEVTLDGMHLQKEYGSVIASMVNFVEENLSEYQKEYILKNATGYYRGDMIIIDREAAFVYDKEYEKIIDLFEFVNIHQLELKYYDKVLDRQLNVIYDRKVGSLPLQSYLPFIGSRINDPVGELGKLRVEISVITEQLRNSIFLSDEPYYAEIYNLLSESLDLNYWQDSIESKLEIIKDVAMVMQARVDADREDLLSVLIIVLILMEFIVGLLHLLK